MLTEAQVQRSFIQMVTKTEHNEEMFERAETLLDNLRPESPLRHRLIVELDELRKLTTAK